MPRWIKSKVMKRAMKVEVMLFSVQFSWQVHGAQLSSNQMLISNDLFATCFFILPNYTIFPLIN